ncbi:MAG: HAD family hydrolase [Desulfarculus sp.]|nr:HAD family hydrolase [Desulfarculus sp.]
MAKRYVLLDRDGTIMADRHYLSDPAGVELLPGAAAGLKAMRRLGLGLLMVSNQSGLGRGYFSEEDLWAVHQRLRQLLAAEGLHLDGAYYCPHAPEEGCACRKPAPGLVEQAAAEHGFDPSQCFVIGDKRADVEMGRAVGAVSMLVRTGQGRQQELLPGPAPHHVVDSLEQAAQVIARLLDDAPPPRRSGP